MATAHRIASTPQPPHRQPAMPLPSGVAEPNVEPLKRHWTTTYVFSASVSIMPALAGRVPGEKAEVSQGRQKPIGLR